MEATVHIPYLREVLVFLAAAGIAVPLLQKRVSPVIGYFLLGSLIGPYGLGLLAGDIEFIKWIVIADLDGVAALGELGVIFLLFVIGLELSFERLWSMRRLVFGLGSAQILVTGSVIAAAALAWGNPTSTSIILGACLALSSTAIVTQLLIESGRLGSPTGRATFSILLMQDLAVVPILFAVSVFSALAFDNLALGLGVALLEAGLTIAGIYVAGRLALRPILRLVAESNSRESFVAIVLLVAVGTAAITGIAGLSMALGAFLAGLLIAETEYRHQVKVDIEPFKGLMLGLFFISVGMGIDWRIVLDNPFWIIASAVGLIGLKAAINIALCLAWRLPRHRAVEVGVLLAQAGEFGFLVVALSVSVGILPADVGQFMLIVVGLTMLSTPALAAMSRRLGHSLEASDPAAALEADANEELEGHVVIAGFGRVGQTVASVLDAQEIQYVAIDKDPVLANAQKGKGRPVRFGDASRLEVLQTANLANAGAVVITIADTQATEELTAQIRKAAPQLPIFTRARDDEHAEHLLAKGADIAIPETVEGSLRLAGRVLLEYGADEDVVYKRIELERSSLVA